MSETNKAGTSSKKKKIMIEDVQVADPEIAFRLKIDKTQIPQKIGHMVFDLKLEENGKTFESRMSVGRTVKYHDPKREETLNDTFDVIFPFVDPHYKAGQLFTYELTITIDDVDYKRISTETIKGQNAVIGDHKYLAYTIQNNRMEYSHLDKDFPLPADGKLAIFDVVAGSPGLGVRISWGKLEKEVYTIRLIGSFENGKAPINVWLNMKKKYKPKYLPLTVFIPYPLGANSPADFQYSFSVELFDIDHKHINFQAETGIPWSVDQPFSSV